MDKGYRYNDIAVITGDMDGYYRYIEEEFSKNNIPAFIDHKHNIASNPFVDGIKAAIEIVEKDFSYEIGTFSAFFCSAFAKTPLER